MRIRCQDWDDFLLKIQKIEIETNSEYLTSQNFCTFSNFLKQRKQLNAHIQWSQKRVSDLLKSQVCCFQHFLLSINQIQNKNINSYFEHTILWKISIHIIVHDYWKGYIQISATKLFEWLFSIGLRILWALSNGLRRYLVETRFNVFQIPQGNNVFFAEWLSNIF